MKKKCTVKMNVNKMSVIISTDSKLQKTTIENCNYFLLTSIIIEIVFFMKHVTVL